MLTFSLLGDGLKLFYSRFFLLSPLHLLILPLKLQVLVSKLCTELTSVFVDKCGGRVILPQSVYKFEPFSSCVKDIIQSTWLQLPVTNPCANLQYLLLLSQGFLGRTSRPVTGPLLNGSLIMVGIQRWSPVRILFDLSLTGHQDPYNYKKGLILKKFYWDGSLKIIYIQTYF